MGLDRIKAKSVALGKKSSSSLLKVNKYENPEMALNLVAHICTDNQDIDISSNFKQLLDKVAKMFEEITEKSFEPSNEKLLREDIYTAIKKVYTELLDNVSSSLKIAVAGGYSAGKSTFLNALTEASNVLPTGIEPVSVVNTYLNCSSNLNKIVVRGENLKGKTVLLNTEVLSCIQHSSKSKVYIASVLNKLMLDVPTKDYLNGVTFIDTPGYNNSSAVNKENNQTDRDTALSSFDESDVIFWCIDIEAGTISKKDFEVLKKAKGKPVVIIFTKMDKKPTDEVKKIISAASELCKKELGADNMPFDIIGFSSVGNCNIYSRTNITIPNLFSSIKRDLNACVNSFSDEMKEIFDVEIQIVEDFIEECVIERNERIDKKNILYNKLRTKEKVYEKLIPELYFNKVISDWVIDLSVDVECNLDFELKELEEKCDELAKQIQLDKSYAESLKKYCPEILSLLNQAHNNATVDLKKQRNKLQKISNEEYLDVFSAIYSDNLSTFLSCFSIGVDITQCNAQGYSPLTLAVKLGNNEMVKFFISNIKNGVDLCEKDQRGYNALETAVICHYEDICKMLIEADKTLINKSKPLKELAKLNKFENWLEKY